MPRYYHEHSYHKQTRFLRRLRRLTLVVVLIFVFSGAYVTYASRRDAKKAETPSKPTVQTTSIVSVPVEIFRTQYFQFQADKDWRVISNESTASKYVYRKFKENLIEHEIVFFINSPEQREYKVAYALPVEIAISNTLKADKTSTHCGKSVPPTATKDTQPITHGGVRFLCTPDLATYYVVVGLKGGGTPITLTRPDGTAATYGLYYRNLTVRNDDRELQEIVKSFQPR